MIFLVNIVLAFLVVYFAFKYFDLRDRVSGEGLLDLGYLKAVSQMIDSAEGYNKAHAVGIAESAEKLAHVVGLTRESLVSLKIAAFLHDCGELAIPREILKSPRKLTQEEWFLVRTHPLIGEFSLRRVLPPHDEVSSIIRWHHERWDGTGYPDRLTGKEIPQAARILAVADAISAMTEERPYRAALSQAQIQEELRRLAGFQFDPEVVKAAQQTIWEASSR